MNINTLVKQFFVENDFQLLADKISVVRSDGVVVFSSTEDFNESYSIGALVGGVWQAANALNTIVSKKSDVLEFRLSFDTSSEGIYILPFDHNDKHYFICSIYKNEKNPAVLKNKMRNIKQTLSFYLKEMVVESVTQSRGGYLFSDITDEEMDKLFNFKRI